MADLKPHRKKNPRGCDRCREHRRVVPAEWILTPEGKTPMYLCTAHARYWGGVHGLEFQPGEGLVPTS